MNKQRSFLFLAFLVIVFNSSSQDFQITQYKLEFVANQLLITYNLDSKNASDKFQISIEIKKQNGESIQPKAITGDLGDNIKSGNSKRIIWDLIKDTIYLDEDISVKLNCERLVPTYSKGSLLLKSTVFPGWAQSKMSGKPWWIGGVAAYGTLAGGIIYYKKALDSFDSYNNEKDDATARDQYWKQFSKEWNNSTAFFITAATIWVANIIWVAVAPSNNKPLKHMKVYFKPVTIPYYQGAMLSLRVDF